MGAVYKTPAAGQSRIANCSGSWQATCDTDVTGWSTINKFIIALLGECNAHGGCNATLRLQWQDLNDGTPTWVDLAATGELKWTSGCNDPGESGCQTPTDSAHVENANQATLATVLKGDFVELRISIDPTDAKEGHEYEFRLFEVGQAALATAASTVTMSTAPSKHIHLLTLRSDMAMRGRKRNHHGKRKIR